MGKEKQALYHIIEKRHILREIVSKLLLYAVSAA
jgi:hypothetical protein